MDELAAIEIMLALEHSTTRSNSYARQLHLLAALIVTMRVYLLLVYFGPGGLVHMEVEE